MTEAVPAGLRDALEDPFAELTGALAGTTRMKLEVSESRRITPGMQRLILTAPELADLAYRPGQDMMLLVAADGRRPVRRRYTIRALDAARRQVTLDVVRHGAAGPGERWIASAEPGDVIEGIAPRGKVFLAEGREWHLFAGDQAGLPAFSAMAEALPATAHAQLVVEVPTPEDALAPAAVADLRIDWLYRGERPAGDPGALVRALARLALPPGDGQVYLAGEAKVVLALRETLAGRGIPPERLSPKAYWGLGRANAGHGEPAKDG